MRVNLLMLAMAASLIAAATVRGAERVVGNQENPWEEWGGEMRHSLRQGGHELPDPWVDWVGLGFQPAGERIVARMDLATEPGWLQPVRVEPSTNLSMGIVERSLRASPVAGAYSGPLNPVDGDSESYISNGPGVLSLRHTMFYVDLGWAFPVNRVRFYTRKGFELFQIPAYTLDVSDGDPADYVPLDDDPTGYFHWSRAITKWTSLARVPINVEHDIDMRFPTRYVRYVALGDTLISKRAKTLWELAEMEIYGDGFLPACTYTSAIIPFENAANWGRLRWHARIDSGATLVVRTRSGQTPDPYRYFVKTGIGPTGQMEVTRAEYRATTLDHNRAALAGPVVEDTDNWSFWSRPHTRSGQAIVSPEPARYFQFDLTMAGATPEARARVDSIVIELSSPPAAQELVGELGYEAVRPGQWAEFQFAVRARFGSTDAGFDAVRIVTPDRVDSISIGNPVVSGLELVPDAVRMEADGFALVLPEHVGPASAGDSALVELAFSTRIFVHGTYLLGSVFDSKAPGVLAQSILPGDATDQLDTNSLQVEWELGGSLLETLRVFPNPFTPNGDGVNDQVRIDYGLFQVDRAVPVSFTIFDLAGRAVYHRARDEGSGPRSVRWDGTNDGRRLVAPGLYVWQIRADTAADEFVESGTVAVVY